jgi:hypothetical protein
MFREWVERFQRPLSRRRNSGRIQQSKIQSSDLGRVCDRFGMATEGPTPYRRRAVIITFITIRLGKAVLVKLRARLKAPIRSQKSTSSSRSRLSFKNLRTLITDGLLGELDFKMDGLEPACDVVVVLAQFASMSKDM